jgi:hypothetical protein
MKYIYNLLILVLLGHTGFAQCTELFISEYIEPGVGKAGCKAIEIYNPSVAAINLAGYSVHMKSNGNCASNQTFDLPPVSLLANDVYVINCGNLGTGFTDPAIIAARDTIIASINYNGNDVVMLVGPLGDTLDIIGIRCNNPGLYWVVGIADSTQNQTLVRMPSVQQGDTIWATCSLQWLADSMNAFQHLGAHTMNPCGLTPSIVSFAANGTNNIESAGTISVPVTILNPNADTTFVTVTATGTTAVLGTDFTFAPQTLVFLPNSNTTQFATYIIVNDLLVEFTEAMTFTLSNPQNTLITPLINISSVTDSIIDDDITALPPTLQFNSISYTTNEGSGTVTVSVSIANANADTTFANLSIVGGSATFGVDYLYTSAQLMFLPNSTTAQIDSFQIIDDLLVEPTEDIIFTITNLQNNIATPLLGSNIQDTISVIDNDFSSPTINFALPVTIATTEANTTLNVTLNVSPPIAAIDSVLISVSASSTATNGLDFIFASQYVLFTNSSSSQSIAINLLDDCLAEGLENIQLVISNPSVGFVIGVDSMVTININDNDTIPTVSFTTATTTVLESIGTFNVNITSSNNYCDTVKVQAQIAGTAINGTDYVLIGSPQTVVFAPNGPLTQSIPFTIIDDNIAEFNESIILVLTPIQNAVAFGITTHFVTINDNDTATLFTFATPTTVSVNEGIVTVLAIVNATFLPTTGIVTMDVNLTGGTATNGLDFTYTTQTLTFNAGGPTSQTISLNIIDDCLSENSEDLILKLQNPSLNVFAGIDSVYTINILPNDTLPTISFVTPAVNSFSEGVGVFTTAAILSKAFCDTVKATVIVNAGTASTGIDYISPSTILLVFAPGVTSLPIQITIIDDAITEATENFSMIVLPTSNCIAGNILTIQNNILDNEIVSNFSFQTATSTVLENVGIISIPVAISAATPLACSVTASLVPGTATNPQDFSGTITQTLNFAANTVGTQNVVITINDNLINELSETFTVVLSTPTNGTTLGAFTIYTVTITDNDVALPIPTIQFANTAQNATENSGTISIPIVLSNTTSNTVTLPFTISGAAVANIDYSLITNSPLTIAPGNTTINLLLNLLDDLTPEATKQLIINLNPSPTNANLGANSTYTVNIIDDDFLGIEEIEHSSMALYPNPIAQNATLNIDKNYWDKKIIMMDMSGKKIVETQLQHTLSLNQLNILPGIYFYKIILSANTYKLGKLIIE